MNKYFVVLAIIGILVFDSHKSIGGIPDVRKLYGKYVIRSYISEETAEYSEKKAKRNIGKSVTFEKTKFICMSDTVHGVQYRLREGTVREMSIDKYQFRHIPGAKKLEDSLYVLTVTDGRKGFIYDIMIN
jgi:hypothetical protein